MEKRTGQMEGREAGGSMTDDQEQEQERIRLHLTAYNAYYWRNLHPQQRDGMVDAARAPTSKEDKENEQP